MGYYIYVTTAHEILSEKDAIFFLRFKAKNDVKGFDWFKRAQKLLRFFDFQALMQYAYLTICAVLCQLTTP